MITSNVPGDDLIDIDFQGIALPAVLLGTDLKVRRFSPQAEKTLNLVSSDINRPITEIKLSIQAPDLDKLVRGVINTGHIYEREIQDRTGRWYSMRIRPYKNKNVIQGTVIVLVDIDNIKVKSDEFKEASDYAEAVIDTLREPFVILKKDLAIESANRSFYHTFEAWPAETVGKDFFKVFCDSAELRDALEEILTLNIAIRDFEIKHTFPRIGQKILLLNARKIQPDNQTAFIFLGIEDITEKKEIAHEHQKAIAALEQFASTASHDLRAPLANIMMFGGLLKAQVPEGSRETLEKMLDAAARMNELMEELLNFSKINAQVELLEPVDLNLVIKQVQVDMESAIDEAKAEIKIEKLPSVKANFTQMYQLFLNLLGNAVKYRKKDTVPIIEVSAAKVTPGFYQIKIRDNGIGFEQKQALEIFKPFKRLHGQREFAGTGLGLSLCENIVKRYGGEINAVSSPGEGALFAIQLPSIF